MIFFKQALAMLLDRREFFLGLVLEHLWLCLTSVAIAAVLGISFGVLIAQKKKLAAAVLGIVNIIYTIPSIALFGLLVSFSGIGPKSAIIALTLYALLPMIRNTYAGIANVDPDILEAALGMGSTPLQMIVKIKFPLALPIIITGFRNMVIMVIAMGGIAAFIGAGGLGTAIYRGITTNNSVMTLLGSALVAALALIIDFLLGRLERRLNLRVFGRP